MANRAAHSRTVCSVQLSAEDVSKNVRHTSDLKAQMEPMSTWTPQWMASRTRATPTASAVSTFDAREMTAHLPTSHPLPPKAHRSTLPTSAPSVQLARTESAPAATHHLLLSLYTRQRRCANSTLTAPTSSAISSTPACRSAAMEPTAKPKDASSLTSRLLANSTLV